MTTMHRHSIMGTWVHSQHHMLMVARILVMVRRINMANRPCMGCSHKDLILNPMVSLGLANLEKSLIRVRVHLLKHMVEICNLNNHTLMLQVVPCNNKATRPMALHPLLMYMVMPLLQLLLLVMPPKVGSLLLDMANLALSSPLLILRLDLREVTVHIHLLSLVMLNNLLLTPHLMGTKRLQLIQLLMALPRLNQLILHLLFLVNLGMLSHLRHSLHMISLLVMGMYKHQAPMVKVCRHSLHTHNMTQVRFMVGIVRVCF